MSKRSNASIMFVLVFFMFFGLAQSALSQDKPDNPIRVDIPVKLEEPKVVFTMDHLAFFGDQPSGMRYMHLLAQRLKEWGTKGHIIGLFYGDATYMVLNDKAYNAYRNVATGNPYKELLANMIKENVQIEVCAVALKGHKWNNDDLLPDIKVNSGAIGRLIQLVQQGYVQVRP
jgi:intracellular sulfur oxidation DsrE/DsrF family protein